MKLAKTAVFLSLFSSLVACSPHNDSTVNAKPNSAISGLSPALKVCDQDYKQDTAKSMSCYQKLAADKPGTIDAYLSLVRFYAEKNPTESIKYAEKGFELAEISPEEKARLYRAMAYGKYQLKDFKGSVDEAREGLNIQGISSNQRLDFYKRIMDAESALGNFSAVRRALEKGVNQQIFSSNDKAKLYDKYVQLMLLTGCNDESKDSCDSIIKIANDGVNLEGVDKDVLFSLYNNLGFAQIKNGQPTLAKQNLNKAIELDPNDTSPYMNLGAISRDSVNQDNTPVENKKLQADWFYNFGLAYQANQRPLVAHSYFSMALQAAPNDEEIKGALSRLPRLDRSIPFKDMKRFMFEVAKNKETCNSEAATTQTYLKKDGNISWKNYNEQPSLGEVGRINELGYTSLYGSEASSVYPDISPVGILIKMAEVRKVDHKNNAFGLNIKAQPIEKGLPCLFTISFDGYEAKDVFFTKPKPKPKPNKK